MLATRYRIKDKDGFERLEKEGKIVQSESFGLSFLPNNDKETSCFGFVISKKISPDSVHRNRIKRALSEAVRQNLTQIKPGFDVVFLAKPLALRKSTDFLMKEVVEALRKGGLIK